MELFERVKHVSKTLARSEARMAALLDLPQRTFNNYLNKKSQRNLWELLPRILESFPQIRREWLYFGEGEAPGGAGAETDILARTAAYGGRSRPLRAAPAGPPEPAGAGAAPEREAPGSTLAELKRENRLLREMLADKIRIIALQEEMLRRRKQCVVADL